MKKFCFIALAALLLQASPALAQSPADLQLIEKILVHPRGFELVAVTIGCGHKYSEDFAADMFKHFKGRQIIATGEVTRIEGGIVSLKVLPRTFVVDVQIKLVDGRVAYDLEKDQRLSIRFTLKQHGGCFMPFFGDGGEIISPRASR